MKYFNPIATLCVLLVSTYAHSSWNWQGLANQDKSYATHIQSRVMSKLPTKIKNLDQVKSLNIGLAQFSERHIARYAKNRIQLNRDFFAQTLRSPKQAPDSSLAQSHADMETLLVAAIIHEIGHLYDLANIQDTQITAKIEACRRESQPRPGSRIRNIGEECQGLLNIRTTVSSDPEFLFAMDYRKVGFIGDNHLRRMNFLESRSPDPYEWKNPREGFAVNLEYFLLDSEFHCRRPTMYNYLAKKLGHQPAKADCKPAQVLMVSGNASAGTQGRLLQVDPSRIYQIDYLFAGKGEAAMSKFGHSMIRLAICSAHRTQVNADCLEDITNHLVVSFRASVEDLQISNLRGIKGDYPSIAFVLPMISVINEYTKTELRELTSLPLKVSRQEIEQFLDTLVETQWTYEGKYKFLSNNCADETLAILKKAWPHKTDLQKIALARPDTMYRRLVELGLGDESAVLNKEAAKAIGLYFPSRREQYDKAVKNLRTSGLLTSETTLDGYLSLNEYQRSVLIDRAQLLDQSIRKRNYASLMLLEDLVLLRQRTELTKEIIDSLMSILNNERKLGKADQKVVNLKYSVDQIKQLMSFFRSPAHLLLSTARYGVPVQSEVEDIAKNKDLIDALGSAKALEAKLEADLQSLANPELLLRVQESKNNYSRLLQLFRAS